MTPQTAKKVNQYVRNCMEEQHIPGLSLAVVSQGEVVIARGYGMSNVELGVAATPETVYQIGSVTKQFTATAVMMLVVEGKISLDDAVSHYVDGIPEAWSRVTIRHLLTHTSGIKSYTDLPDLMQRSLVATTREEILSLVVDMPVAFAPGEQYAYCNTGYFLLGHAIERAASQRYGDFLLERIFGPLGMTSTRVNDMAEIIPNRAAGYNWEDDHLMNAAHTSMTWPFSAGALVSTVTDLTRWNLAVGGGLLPPDVWSQMFTQATLNDGTMVPYGLGWGLSHDEGHTIVFHGGGIPGFICFTVRYPDDGLAIIVLTNLSPSEPSTIVRGIACQFVSDLTPVSKSTEPR